jgi:RNA polymerase sigma-70 factor, ECF subfamily
VTLCPASSNRWFVVACASPARPDLGAVFNDYFDYVWNTLERLGVRRTDLEDVTDEVFAKVCGRFGDYDPTRPIRPWLFGFAYRVAADYRRSARFRFEVTWEPPEQVDATRPVDERMEVEEERRLVLHALASLDLAPRAILIMYEIDGIPVPEIAQVLGIPRNTAQSRLRLARGQLAEALRRLKSQRGAP